MSRNYERHPEMFPEHNALHNPVRTSLEDYIDPDEGWEDATDESEPTDPMEIEDAGE